MKIPTNESGLDRGIRIAAGAVLGWVFASGMVSGGIAGLALAASLVLLLTGITGFCPLYALLGFNTAHPQPRERRL